MVRDYLRRLCVAGFPVFPGMLVPVCASMKKALLSPPLGVTMPKTKFIKHPEKCINRRNQHYPDILTQFPPFPYSQVTSITLWV